MPKTKLGCTTIVNPVKQLETFNMFVRIGMARKGLKTQEQLGGPPWYGPLCAEQAHFRRPLEVRGTVPPLPGSGVQP